MQNDIDANPHHRGWAIAALGVFLVLLGIPQVVGGAWLIGLGGSWYYLPAGAALCASGVLLIRGRSAGAWLYLAFFALTAAWSVWEIGIDGWGLLPRVFGLTLVLALVVLCLPRLYPAPASRIPAIAGVSMLVVVALAFTIGIVRVTSAKHFAPVPTASAAPAPTSSAAADWPVYAGTANAQRYSTLSRITRANVAQLQRAWLYHTRDVPQERWGAE